MSRNEFDRLFERSVPHIFEKIFFSLNYDSFKKCREVSKAWNELHYSERYRQMAGELLQDKRENERLLCHHSNMGNAREVGNLLKSGIDIECTYRDIYLGDVGRTPLHKAAFKGNTEIVKMLLEAGANPNKADKEAKTPLHEAVISGRRPEIVKLLLDTGADPTKADLDGRTPLYWAALMGHKNMVKFLLDAGILPTKADHGGRTPLFHAVLLGNTEMVNLFLDAGADPTKADLRGNTPLHDAAFREKSEVVKILLAAGADPDKTDNGGATPLHKAVAACTCKPEMLQLLLDAGADPGKADKIGRTPLSWARYRGNTEAVKALLAAGADSNAGITIGKIQIGKILI